LLIGIDDIRPHTFQAKIPVESVDSVADVIGQ
jgi:hypothetical protein